jgi:hypothetical protein
MRKNLFSKWLITLTAVMFIFVLAVAAFGGDATKTQEQPKPVKMAKNMEAMKGLLDGKYFLGQIGQEGETTGKEEAIAFRHGTFHSSAYDTNGFASAPYTATEEGGVIKFNVTCTSPKSGTIEWSGTVKGNELDATATMVQEGKNSVTMWAKGTAAKMGHMTHNNSAKSTKSSGESKKVGS